MLPAPMPSTPAPYSRVSAEPQARRRCSQVNEVAGSSARRAASMLVPFNALPDRFRKLDERCYNSGQVSQDPRLRRQRCDGGNHTLESFSLRDEKEQQPSRRWEPEGHSPLLPRVRRCPALCALEGEGLAAVRV